MRRTPSTSRPSAPMRAAASGAAAPTMPTPNRNSGRKRLKPSAPAASDSGDSQPSSITSVVVIRFIARLVSTIGALSAKVATISRRRLALAAPGAAETAIWLGVMVPRRARAKISAERHANGLGERAAEDRVLIRLEMDAVEVGAGNELPRVD